MKETWTAGRLLEVSGAYWQTCALHAGVKLDVFTVLAGGAMAAEGVAERIASSLRGVALLLNALTAMGLLVREGDRYANSEAARLCLVSDSEESIVPMILHHHHLMESWARLPVAVQEGRPIRKRSTFQNREVRESFLMGMFTLANRLAPAIVRDVDLTGRRHFLDLGGGPGTYAIHFCMHYEGLRATVFDLKTTRPFARRTIRRFGMEGRVAFRAGDYLEDDLGRGYDVAWLSQILHGEGPEDCRTIVARAAEVLEPGGLLLVHEFLLNDAKDGPLHPALFSLNMLLGTREGRSYSEAEVREMLAAAGLRDIRRLPLRAPGDSGIVTGVKGL
jgi:hypothetical protein